MLSFLKLRVAGFGAGETGLRIWNSNGTLRYAYPSLDFSTMKV